MKEMVFEIVARLMAAPVTSVDENSSPKSLERWDSLRHMKLILAVEERFGIQFSDEDIISIKDVKGLLTRIEIRLKG